MNVQQQQWFKQQMMLQQRQQLQQQQQQQGGNFAAPPYPQQRSRGQLPAQLGGVGSYQNAFPTEQQYNMQGMKPVPPQTPSPQGKILI